MSKKSALEMFLSGDQNESKETNQVVNEPKKDLKEPIKTNKNQIRPNQIQRSFHIDVDLMNKLRYLAAHDPTKTTHDVLNEVLRKGLETLGDIPELQTSMKKGRPIRFGE